MRFKSLVVLCALVLIAALIAWWLARPSYNGPYRLLPGEECDGFPKVEIGTAAGYCVGLVIGPEDEAVYPEGGFTLVFPRNLLWLPQTQDILVADLGRWEENRGRLWKLTRNAKGRYDLVLLHQKLDRPHGLALGPDGYVYLGEASQIVRLDPQALELPPEPVITGLSADGLHPLTSLAFLLDGDLIVGEGSASDLCRDDLGESACTDQGARLLRYTKTSTGSFALSDDAYARGLRNPLGLAVLPDGMLYVADSAHDLPDDEKPYDELNRIDAAGADFGWPYCEDVDLWADEWAAHAPDKICTEPKISQPVSVLPPHSTPLALVPAEDETGLLVSLHGYRGAGHRIAYIPLVGHSEPTKSANRPPVTYQSDTPAGPQPIPYNTARSKDRALQLTYLIDDWSPRDGIRPQGSPTGLMRTPDGAIWITEDRNKTILRLVRDPR